MEKENEDTSIDGKGSSNSSHLALEETLLAQLKIATDPNDEQEQESSVKQQQHNNSSGNKTHQDEKEPAIDDDEEDIEPVDPWDDNVQLTEDPFTEEELMNVLRSFDEDDDNENNQNEDHNNNSDEEDNIEFFTKDALPELVFVEDESMLLAPAEFTASIFDSQNNNTDTNPPDNTSYRNTNLDDDQSDDDNDDGISAALATKTEVESEKNLEHLEPLSAAAEEEKKGSELIDDIDALGLLEGLQNLNLDWKQDDDYNQDYYNDHDFDIPPYLYCQPCAPVGKSSDTAYNNNNNNNNLSLASISEDQVLSLDPNAYSVAFRQLLEKDRPRLPQREFDTLLQLSLMGLEDGEAHTNHHGYPHDLLSEAEMDSLFTAQGATTEEHGGAPIKEDMATEQRMERQLMQQHQQQQCQQQPPSLHVSTRPEELSAASDILSSFVVTNAKSGLQNERSCLGHKETTYGASFSECGKYLATASQDSTVRIWDVARNAALTTLTEHSTEYECLRVAWASSKWGKDNLDRGKDSDFASLLATAGADGIVKVWCNKDPTQKDSWVCCAALDHSKFERLRANPDDEADKPQVYALQWIDHWSGLPLSSETTTQNSFLLTSSDDFIHLWELDLTAKNAEDDGYSEKLLLFREVLSIHFGAFSNPGFGVSVCQVTESGLGLRSSQDRTNQKSSFAVAPAQKAFGGDRNPNNMIFVFDADYCRSNGLLGVALSDGSLRLMNGRGVCISIMQLPGCQSHLTSFSWDSTGTRLATCVATGHVIIWGVDVHDNKGSLTTTCTAILEGGHQPGRPVFGSRFIGGDENLLLSWGVDGRLCMWDSFSQGNIEAPIATLVQNSNYPIYAVDVQPSCVAVGGGVGGEASFLGVPVMLYDIKATHQEKS